MSCRILIHNKSLLFVIVCLVTLGIVVYPTPSLYAQDIVDAEEHTSSNTAVDESTIHWQDIIPPYVEKPEANITSPDDVKEKKQFAYSLFLPSAGTDSNAQAASTNATWQTIHLETFEGTYWPASADKWAIRDVNGPNVGVKLNEFATVVWDDNATRGYNSSWSANPNDGAWAPQPGASPTYANHTDTWMRYGPFSLVGATDARFSFVYWLDSEASYDFFSWEVACNNSQTANWSLGEARSGPVQKWVSIVTSIGLCRGQSNVYLKFNFKSDYSNPTSLAPSGVWVDNIKIEKYQ